MKHLLTKIFLPLMVIILLLSACAEEAPTEEVPSPVQEPIPEKNIEVIEKTTPEPHVEESPAPTIIEEEIPPVPIIEEPAPIPPDENTIEPVYENSVYINQLTDEERLLIEGVVMAEASNQSLEGQMAVSQCILNTAEATGCRPGEVVQVPNQYAAPAMVVSDSVKEAVAAVFDRGERVTDEPIRFFYAPRYGYSEWHETALEYVITIEDHKFFKIPN